MVTKKKKKKKKKVQMNGTKSKPLKPALFQDKMRTQNGVVENIAFLYNLYNAITF